LIVVDTGIFLAYFVASDPDHETARVLLESTDRRLATTPLVIAELDYFILERFGPDVEARVLRYLLESPVSITPFGAAELAACTRLLARYKDLELGLTDASVLSAAEDLGTSTIATLDFRDFRAVTTESGRAFDLLPRG